MKLIRNRQELAEHASSHSPCWYKIDMDQPLPVYVTTHYDLNGYSNHDFYTAADLKELLTDMGPRFGGFRSAQEPTGDPPELEPCPFCTDEAPDWKHNADNCWIECSSCGATGPLATVVNHTVQEQIRIVKDAAKLWNQRPPEVTHAD